MNAQSIFKKEQQVNRIDLRIKSTESRNEKSVIFLKMIDDKLEIISYQWFINRKIKFKIAFIAEYK